MEADGTTTAVSEPAAWADPNPDRPVPFWDSVRQDLVAHVPAERRGASRAGWARMAAGIAARSSGFHVVLSYRLAHSLRFRLGLFGRALAGGLFWWSRHFDGCSIAPSARLFGGLILPHPHGIVIGPEVVVGPRAWIFQNATLGGAPGKPGMPRVGADARIYSGAVLTGPIVVGDNVMIGANVVVFRDIPPRMVVRPAASEISPLPSHFQVETP